LPQLRHTLATGALLTPALVSDPSLPFRLGAGAAAAVAAATGEWGGAVPAHAWSSLDGALEMVGLWPQAHANAPAAAAGGADVVTLDALGMGRAGITALLAQGGRFDAGTAKRAATLLQAALLLRHQPPATAGGGGGADATASVPSAWTVGLPRGVLPLGP
jgi:hypothetical protein